MVYVISYAPLIRLCHMIVPFIDLCNIIYILFFYLRFIYLLQRVLLQKKKEEIWILDEHENIHKIPPSQLQAPQGTMITSGINPPPNKYKIIKEIDTRLYIVGLEIKCANSKKSKIEIFASLEELYAFFHFLKTPSAER